MTARLRFILFLLVFSFFAVIARLFYWQVVRAEELSLIGKSQYGTVVKLSPKRGEIKTADNFPIVKNKPSFLVFANPKEVKDKGKTADFLSSLLETDVASISSVLEFDRLWVPIKSDIDNKTKEEIEKLRISGIGFEEQSTRFYPEASLAAHLTGFVGKNELGENKGYFGLEGYYDRQLRGKEGLAVQIHDALGRPILSRMNDNSGAVDGRTLISNIERPVQFLAEKKLKEGIERFQAAGGMVGILEPKSGKVIAMASFPTYDQKEYQKYSEVLYKNPFISNIYEPGSTFKSLIMAAALDSGVLKPDTKCTICKGPITIGDYEIRTWNNKYHESMNMIEVIQYSDNTGMVFVAQSLGLEKILSSFERFGIGDLTGIDLQGEVSPSIRPKNAWYPIDVATAGFGQGISVTPIELLVAFSSIANGGVRMEPHVVSKIETPEGKVIDIPDKILGRTMSSKTAKVMTEILVNAIDKGEAKWAKPKGYRIAGKTGTAQIPISGHYDPNKTIASFIGFAPADDPKFVMLVIVDKPTTSIYGSETAAPIFFSIAREVLNYYGISPSE